MQKPPFFFSLFFLLGCLSFLSCRQNQSKANGNGTDTDSVKTEIIYHVFQRSFYDSDSNMIGDLKGLKEKLGYLQDLGITAIQLLPLYQSPFYHNYFTDDFYKIDSTLGTMEDYISLVKEIHRRGMKVYMDMETQYVTGDHPWFKDAYNNLKSPYSDYLIWKDSAHTLTENIVMNLTELKGYNGVVKKLALVNLRNKEVLDYNIKLYTHWLDPNNDGNFDDGVDGFRFDHMMDNLDYKPQLTDLFATYWVPLIEAIKKKNPAIQNVAEQAEWSSWALDYITKAHVDRVFSFKLMGGIRSFSKSYLTSMADSAAALFPPGLNQVIFIENHDLPRFANQVNGDLHKLKIGAALNLLLGQVPAIYYGQEIGMNGKGEWKKWGMTDANEIPDREAFEWYRADSGKGIAWWYKNSGPWWDERFAKPDDGISLEEESADSASLYHFYKKMISLRKDNPVITTGAYQTLSNTSDSVFSFQRYDQKNAFAVVVNLSGTPQQVAVDYPTFDLKKAKTYHVQGTAAAQTEAHKVTLTLEPYAIEAWKLTP